MTVYYIVPTAKSVSEAARDLGAAVERHEFGVLHVHDLAETLARKGHPLGAQCKVFEVCNPRHAARVLKHDMRLNMALPCRISVYEDCGVTHIGTILPTEIFRTLSPRGELADTAAAVEAAIKAIIEEAAAADARQVLSWRRAALAREIASGVEKRRAESDGNVPDSGELATAAVEREVGIAEVDRDVAELEAIDSALARLETGTYGRCVECGKAIDNSRLAHNPEVARCVTCQLGEEKRSFARVARL
jgi:RNA polymerase-binding protein DksA